MNDTGHVSVVRPWMTALKSNPKFPAKEAMRAGWAALLLLMILAAASSPRAQAPTGTIAGTVTDSTGAVLADAKIDIVNRDTRLARVVATSAEGLYGAPALPPGRYVVTGEVPGFRRIERTIDVEAGTTTTVDLRLALGDVSETVIITGAVPLIHYDHHQVGGVVTRDQIENLPLNGRNFLDLAALEPGVTSLVRGTNNRLFVSFLGSGNQFIPRVGYTRVTVDGANIGSIGGIGSSMYVSQEAVQEFQLATVNFDLSTSLTSNGAINIVTRSGGNTAHGDGFFFYRDNNLSAYPGLSRDGSNPDPFFERRQFGAAGGGPVRRNRVFFFASYERNDQRGVTSVQPAAAFPEFAPLLGIFPTLLVGNQFTGRLDARITANHNAFARYTHDSNRDFGPLGAVAALPSGWSSVRNGVDQTLVALTSVLAPALVNDMRISYFFLDSRERPASAEDCTQSYCVGVGAPRITIQSIGLALGKAREGFLVGGRFQATNSLMWQKGTHRLRFGFDWEHASHTTSNINRDPASITLFSPGQVRQFNPSMSLPDSFNTLEDILRLPVRSFEIGLGSGEVPQRGFRRHRVFDQYRLHAGDIWQLNPRLTVNAGLAWAYEPNALNHDLTKPPLLIPILGSNGLNAPPARLANFSPTLGFAWTATSDARTVVRGGIGRFFDPLGASLNSLHLSNERLALLPVGAGRVVIAGTNILWNGVVLDFPKPTSFTGAELLSILEPIRDEQLALVRLDNRDSAVRNIDHAKSGQNLYDPAFATPHAIHVNVGLQRELAGGIVLTADLVWRRFIHTFLHGIDYNRWASKEGPVIPACTQEQVSDDRAACSNGNIYFDTTIGQARYTGMLLRVEKRLARGSQFLVSYALGSYVGTNSTATGTVEGTGGRATGFNNDDWLENHGPLPTDLRHILNASGVLGLPWGFQAAVNLSASSRAPFSAWVATVDFNHDGTQDDLLPGTRVNQFGRGLDKAALETLVQRYNAEVAGTPVVINGAPSLAPRLSLPQAYSFGDTFFTIDARLTHSFRVSATGARVSLVAEVFNLFNTANLVGYRGALNTPGFGQPSGRFTQIFGSGGPRAFQLAARFGF